MQAVKLLRELCLIRSCHLPLLLLIILLLFLSVLLVYLLTVKTQRANFSSVLTVDLLELNKQNVRNITCGDLLFEDTQQVKIVHFTPNVTALYQFGILSGIEVELVG